MNVVLQVLKPMVCDGMVDVPLVGKRQPNIDIREKK